MSKLAPKLGITDVGLAKICKKAAIPIPPRGYWAKLQHGKRVRRTTLPKASPAQSDEIQLPEKQHSRFLSDEDLPTDILEKVALVRDEAYSTRVTKQPSKLHHLLSREPGSRLPEVGRRLLAVKNALYMQVEALGGNVTIDEKRREKLTVCGESLEVSVSQPYKIIQTPLSAEDRRWSWHAGRDTKPVHVPTGSVRIRIDNYLDRPIRRTWADRDNLPLEDQFREVLLGLLFAAAAEREKRLVLEEGWRRMAEAQKRREELAERHRQVAERIKAVRAEAIAFEDAERIRRYVHVKVKRSRVAETSTEELSAWSEWVLRIADALDPLVADITIETLVDSIDL